MSAELRTALEASLAVTQREPCADEQALDALAHLLGALPLGADPETPFAVSAGVLRRVLKLANRGFALGAAPRGELFFVGEVAKLAMKSPEHARRAGALLFTTVALIGVDAET